MFQQIMNRLCIHCSTFRNFIAGIIVISETMTFRQKSLMDIEIDNSTCSLLPLKRYNSAPYINSAVSDITVSSDSMTKTTDTVAR